MKRIYNKLLFLGVLTAVAIVAFIPSLTSSLPSWWNKILPHQGLCLGLDLQGGMHLILKVNLPRTIKNQIELSVNDLRDVLRSKQVMTGPTETLEEGRIRLNLIDAGSAETVKKIIEQEFSSLMVDSTSITEGSAYLVLALKGQEVQQLQENTVDQALEVIRNRIDQFGVTEPVIVKQGKDEIVVQLPGIQDPQRALELIGRTAQLEFKLVNSENGVLDLSGMITDAVQKGALKANYSHQELNHALTAKIPADSEIYFEKKVDRETRRVTMVPLLLKKKVVMTGDSLKTARVDIGGTYNEPQVSMTFNSRGARLFGKITTENVNKRLAIVLDDVVQSAPNINEPITGGNAQITGSFDMAEASDLAIVLRAGALPAPVDIVQNLTVGPSLGRDSIRKGIGSAILGCILVVAFMTIYYRISGVIANMALFLNLILMMGVLSLFHATLTLPGIAGIVLSIGMAVDSNVLIFERMREEFELKKPFWSGVDGGYGKALWTIIDSHVTTLITAFALFLFGTGPIKGFAVTLSVGVILNLFTALYGTRVVYDYLKFKRLIKDISFLHIIRKPKIDFIKLRNVAFLFSGALSLLGIVALWQIHSGRANLGVELAGGTMVQFKAEKKFNMEDVRSALTRNKLSDYELQDVRSENILMVRVKKTDLSVGQVADNIETILSKEIPENKFSMESKAEIGASVSQALKKAALLAIVISMAGIILYLAWRFDFRFGVAAAIATFHDVLAVLGIFYLLDKEITLLVITALLTLAGYSLTDTVVVFDRIRENLKFKGKQTLGEVINRSINEVLSRTIVTSGTVFIVLVALLIMGGVLLRDFALALTIGVVVGTYSSIFIASPIIYIWASQKKGNPVGGLAKSKR